MEQQEIKNAIKERFESLQPEIQQAIMDSNYEKELYDISNKHKLSIDQMGDLELNTTLVMLGEIHPDEYSESLKEDLNLPQEKIDEIVNDVNEKIMKNIRQTLKDNFEKEDKEEAEWNEVPIPPYKEEVSVPVPPKEEIQKPQNTLGDVGIEMIEERQSYNSDKVYDKTSKTDRPMFEKSGVNVLETNDKKTEVDISSNASDVLSGVENPPKLSTSIMGDKLTKTVYSNSTENKTIPETNDQIPRSDSYRESI